MCCCLAMLGTFIFTTDVDLSYEWHKLLRNLFVQVTCTSSTHSHLHSPENAEKGAETTQGLVMCTKWTCPRCGLALMFLVTFECTDFWKGQESIPFVSSLILALVACLDSSATSWLCQCIKWVCVWGAHVGHVNCTQYRFHSQLILTFIS